MSSKTDVTHPAIAAWREIAPDAPAPRRVEVLRQRFKSTTYRLVGLGGGTIIAQRSQTAKAEIERAVYEQILPHLSLSAPQYYGAIVESPDWTWLFLEDVGDEPYSATDPAHTALAARWLGAMHTMGARVPAARELPDGGPARYLDHLRVGRDAIQACFSNAALTATAITDLRRLVSELDHLERDWACVERACAGAAMTLVHGDFRPKNAYIRGHASRPELLAIDWEMAGWGVPAIDLLEIDLPTYWSVVRSQWPEVQLEDLRRLRAVGLAFRWLAAIRWRAPELRYDKARWLIKSVVTLQVAQRFLVDAVQTLAVHA